MTSADSSTSRAALDRARGALVGLAVGDAVGTTLEFRRPGSFEPIDDLVGGGPFDLLPGQWTDDTSMALCMAESIVDLGGIDLADHHRRYLAWRNHGYFSSTGSCFDIGGTTTSQLDRFARTGETVDPAPDQESAANGSLMRLAAAPVAWHRSLDDAIAMSAESSRSTHPAERPVDGCRLMGAMIAALIGGAAFDEVAAPEFWEWGALHPQVGAIAGGTFRTKEPPHIRGTGFCIDALEAALWAVHGATDFRDAVLRAANLGDDADTTAAIAGQLAGARWGMEAIPVDWRNLLAMRPRIVSLADALFHLHSDEPNDHWHHDADMHGWWVEPGRLLAGEYPGNAAGDVHKIDLLLDAGVRTFVDLTTPADRLTPYEEALMERAAFRRLDVRRIHHPIPDLGTIGDDGYRAILADLAAEHVAGRPMLVHCWGGIGRTGSVVGCWLVENGVAPSSVLDHIASLRAGTRKAHRDAPETSEQRALVSSWAPGKRSGR